MAVRVHVTFVRNILSLIQSKAFDGSVIRAPKTFLLSTAFFIYQSFIKDNDGYQVIFGNHIKVLEKCCQDCLTVLARYTFQIFLQ